MNDQQTERRLAKLAGARKGRGQVIPLLWPLIHSSASLAGRMNRAPVDAAFLEIVDAVGLLGKPIYNATT